MTHVEKETIEAFCRELALALRRITGRNVVSLENTPGEIREPAQGSDQAGNTNGGDDAGKP